MTDNPNEVDKDGKTPIYVAAEWGFAPEHIEIIKILAPLTDNPNAPDHNGKTPIEVTENKEIRKILKSFINPRKRKARPSSKPSKKTLWCRGGGRIDVMILSD